MPPRQGELEVGADATVRDMNPVARALLEGVVSEGSPLIDLARAVVHDERALVVAALVLLAATPALGGERRLTLAGGGQLTLVAEPEVAGSRRVLLREGADDGPASEVLPWARLVPQLPGALGLLSDDGVLVAANRGWAEATGRSLTTLVGHPPARQTLAADAGVAGALAAAVEGRLLDEAWAQLRLQGDEGDVVVVDHRRRVAGGIVVALRPADPGGGTVVDPDAMTATVLITDAQGRVTWANAAAHRLRRTAPGSLAGVPLVEAVPGSGEGEDLGELLEGVRRDGRAGAEIAVAGPAGDAHVFAWAAGRHGDGAVLTGVDVTGRHHHTAELTHRAFHDPLTGLPNRALLLERLHHAVGRLDRVDGDLAVLFLDLNGFKAVNDRLGHDAGDRLLAALAERLRSVLRPADTVARLGGDEFVVVCEDVAGGAEVAAIIDRMVAAIEQPFHVAGTEATVSVSVGVALARETGGDVEALLRDADVAMYRAKAGGPLRSVVGAGRPRQDAELRRAIDAGEIAVVYQPIVDLRDGRTASVEALARWHHPERGVLRPEWFLAVAEATGLVVPLGASVLHRACRDAATWAGQARRTGRGPVPVSVNLSLRELSDDALVDTAAAALEAAALDPAWLRVEVAEHSFVRDPGVTFPALRRLAALGVEIVVDDAGLALPAATALRELQVAEVKVEGSAVRRLPAGDLRARRAAEEVAELGRTLALRTVAEGVETDEQLRLATDLGFDHAQGHLFAPPQAADVVVRLLAADVRWPVLT